LWLAKSTARVYSVVLDVSRILMIKMPLSVIAAILAITVLFVLAAYFVPPLAIAAVSLVVLMTSCLRIYKYFEDGE